MTADWVPAEDMEKIGPGALRTAAESSPVAAPESAAVRRVRALASSWASLPRQDDPDREFTADVDRRAGTWLLGILDADPGVALEGARILAEGWMRPGSHRGLFWPAGGQAVLDAIRGAGTGEEAGWRERAEAAEFVLNTVATHCRERAHYSALARDILAIIGSEEDSRDAS